MRMNQQRVFNGTLRDFAFAFAFAFVFLKSSDLEFFFKENYHFTCQSFNDISIKIYRKIYFIIKILHVINLLSFH